MAPASGDPRVALFFRFHILQLDPACGAQAFPRLLDPTQKSRIVFKPVVEPVLFRSNPINTPAGLP